MNNEELEIVLRARDEFTQALKVAQSGLDDLTKDIEDLGGAERAAAHGARELVRWQNVLSGEVRKNQQEITRLNAALGNFGSHRGILPGFEGLVNTDIRPAIDQIRQLDQEVKKLTPEPVNELQMSLDDFMAQMPPMQQAIEQVEAPQKRLNKTIKEGEDNVRRFGIRTEFTSFQLLRFGAALAGVQLGISVLATTVIGLRNAVIKTNSEVEIFELQFKTLMGSADAAKEHVSDLFEFAKTTPFAVTPVIEASRTLRTFGGDVLDNVKTLRLLGDTSAATGTELSMLTFWIGRAYTALKNGQPFGEAASRLQELAVLTPEARLQIERLADAGRGMQAFDLLTDNLRRFTGALEEQALTWRGATSTAIDSSKVLLAEGFKPLFNGVKDLIISFNELSESSGEEFAAALAGTLSVVGSVLSTLVGEVVAVIQSFRQLPPEIQALVLGFYGVLTVAPLVAAAIRAVTAALTAQMAALLANPWTLAAVAITTGIVVAMRLLRRETDKTNESLGDQVKKLRELHDISKEELESELNAALRVLEQTIAARAALRQELIADPMIGEAFERTGFFKDAEKAVQDAQAVVDDFTASIDLRNRVLEKGEDAIRAEIKELEAQEAALKKSRDALDEINLKLKTHQELTEEEQKTLDQFAIAIGEVADKLTIAEAELAFIQTATGSSAGAIDGLTTSVRELKEELISLSASSIAKELTLDIEELGHSFAQGAVDIQTFMLQSEMLMNGALFKAESAKKLQDTAEMWEELITRITGLGAKEDKPAKGPRGKTEMELLLEDLQALADQGGPAIDELTAKLETYRQLAESTGDTVAVALIDRFFELGGTIANANSALTSLQNRLGDIEDQAKSLKEAFDNLRSATINDINTFGGLLETAIKRQAQKTLDGILSSHKAERDALKALQDQAKDIVNGAQVEMTDAVDWGTRQRIAAITSEADALRNGINAELAEIQQRLDELNARDFAHQLEMIDRELKQAWDPREIQKLLDRREQVIRREEQQELRNRQKNLQDQLKSLESSYVDEFKEIIEERTGVLDRAEEVAKELFEQTTDAYAVQTRVRIMLLNGEVDEMARLLNEFVPEWRTAGKSYGEQLIDGIRESGIESYLTNLLGDLVRVQTGSPETGPGKALMSANEIAMLNSLGAQQKASGVPSFVLDALRNRIIEQGAVPSFKEGGYARSAMLAVVGDRPGGEHMFGDDQLRKVIREEVNNNNIGVRVFIGERELTDIVRVEIDDSASRAFGQGALERGVRIQRR